MFKNTYYETYEERSIYHDYDSDSSYVSRNITSRFSVCAAYDTYTGMDDAMFDEIQLSYARRTSFWTA